MANKNEIDEFFCKCCKKSMVGQDGFCMNCGHDTTNEGDPEYEDENLRELMSSEDLDLGEWDD